MKSFTTNYIWQRITSIILLFLVPWFLWLLFKIKGLSYFEVLQILKSPIDRSLIFLMVISSFYHGYLGIKNICLDYLPNEKIRFFIRFFVGAGFTLLSLLTAFSLLKLGCMA